MELNEQQINAVEYSGPARNVLVNAGAGCGKTRTIVARAAYLIKSGTDASRVLMVTFTNRAAREMRIRLKGEVGVVADKIDAGTFHSFCLQVIGKIPNSFGVAGLNIIDADDQISLMTLVRRLYIGKKEKKLNKEFPRPRDLIKYLSYSRNTCQNPELYLSSNTELPGEFIEMITHIFLQYQKAKEARGYLDFDDILEVYANAVEQKPKLAKAIAGLYDEVLVDEMQDTNPLQFRILKSFSSNKTRLFCVGDPAQSIYKFRGAEFKHVYNFTETFKNSVVFPLSLNYRSNQEILNLANWLLGRSPFNYSNDLKANRGLAKILPRVCDFESPFEEASMIADEVIQFHEQNQPYSKIMVLTRTAFGAKPLEAEFIRRSIPYRFIGGTILSKSAHVRDILALLRIVRNTKDDLAWMRFVQLWPGIGEKTALRIVNSFDENEEVEPTEILASRVGETHGSVSAIKKTAEERNSVKNCITTAVKMLSPVLKERYDKWNYRSRDLELLITVASRYSSLGEFVDAFTLEPMTSTEILKLENDDAVILITVHSAKGTESDVCYVIDAKQGVYPHCRSFGEMDSEEEERRILYVALTRARNKLTITRSASTRGSFFTRNKPTSGEEYFLAELPDTLVSREIRGWMPRSSEGLSSLKDVY